MTIRLLFILTFLTNTTWGQSSANNDILEIIKIGVRENRLPRQLINNVDSIYETSVKRQYSKNNPQHYPLTIPVQWTKENGLKQGENIKWDKIEIWVWGEEDFFMYDVYWITPSNIKRKGDKLTFDYSTHTWLDKKVKYYKGTLKAEKVSGQWIVNSSKMTETKNTFDAWKKLKEGNER
jgi:hypothetical protein